jgi:hypothetical protein
MPEPLLRRDLWDEALWTVAAGSLYLIIFGFGGVIALAIRLIRPLESAKSQIIATLISLAFVPLLIWMNPLAHPVRHFWLDSLLLIGLAYPCLNGLIWFARVMLRPLQWDQWLAWLDQRYEQRINRRVAKRLKQSIPVTSQIELGLWVEGERFPDTPRLSLHKDLIVADPALFDRHTLLIGAPGSGKSEAIKRLVSEFAAKTDRHLYLIDAKGELTFAQQMQTLLQTHRQHRVPLFLMGHAQSGDSYNGLAGNSEAVAQRLKAMFRVESQQGDAEFYANVNRALLTLVCEATAQPPRSLEEFDLRMNLDWLEYAYRHDPAKLQAIGRYAQWFAGARVRADSLIWDFAKYVSPSGFTLDDTPAAIFSLRTSAVGDTARRFFDFLIEDFKDWVGKRQSKPSLLVIDEVGQVHAESLLALIELGRSAQMGIILATQDLATIADLQARDRLLGSVQTKILMQTDAPETIGDRAGTRQHAHMTYQTDELQQPTGLGSIRLEDERKVNLNRVRRFPAGRAYLIHGGESAVMHFRSVAK